ncbi:THAP domain-containing protein 1-like isoform X5, partial [Aphis craccivora]
TFICSEHFIPDNYQIRPGASVRLLKDDAYPTVFNGFPKYLQKKMPVKRRLLTKNNLTENHNLNSNTLACSSTLKENKEDIVDNFPPEIENFADKSVQCVITSPTKQKLRQKIKSLQQRLKRRNLKIKSLKGLINNIKKHIPSSDEIVSQLDDRFSGYPLHILLHERKCKTLGKNAVRYSKIMKDFSKTLFFYSPKAYAYVRTLFTLPHPSTIRSWMSSTHCKPGFLSEVFNYLKEEVKKFDWLQDCCLIFDSMAIKKQLIWESSTGKFLGNIEFGDGSENSELATEALVFLVVSLTKRFKCPIAYFFVNKINSSVLSTLITSAISKLYDIGIRIWSVTCDGASSNVQCFKKLGCNFNANENDFNCKFTVGGKLECNAMFDACHMLKLVRNSLADKKLFKHSDHDGIVQWKFIVALNNFQNDIGLKFANKLTSQHVHYRNNIMKVKLAAQSLSSGVADAIEYLQQKGEISFQKSESTVYFIRQIDRLFDILNSRIPFAKGYKSPINASNIKSIESVFNNTIDYLKTLRIEDSPVYLSGRKMFIIGFIVNMKSTLEMSYKLLYKNQNPLKFILTYKVSQDHLELFFACVRSRGGCNNNPNCIQFKHTLRQLLFTRNITVNSGNCCDFDALEDEILEFRSEKRSMMSVQEETTFDDDESEIQTYLDQLNNLQLGEYVNDILDYISGYIIRSMVKKLSCTFCIKALTNHQSDHTYANSLTFTSSVNRGKLFIVSKAISLIVQHLEKAFQIIVVKEKELHKNVSLNIFECAKKSILAKNNNFFFTGFHPINVDLGAPSHEYTLFKAISKKFINIRMRHYQKEYNIREVQKNKSSLRVKLSKLA